MNLLLEIIGGALIGIFLVLGFFIFASFLDPIFTRARKKSEDNQKNNMEKSRYEEWFKNKKT